jgi:hypothetical protein
MSTPAKKDGPRSPRKRKRSLFVLATGVLAASTCAALLAAAVERIRDASDRSH